MDRSHRGPGVAPMEVLMISPIWSARRSFSPAGLTGRLLAATAVAGLAGAMVASPASAAVPANDEVGGAVSVDLGSHVTLDTTDATTTSTDADLNSECGAPETKASVWYTYTAAADGGVLVDMTSSSYSGGFLVFEGAPTVETLVACGPGTVGFTASNGSTYTIMVIDDDGDEDSSNGGSLVLDVLEAPPLPTIDVTVNPKGKVDKSGTAWVSGTYSCTDADFIELDGELHQSVGRFIVNGYGFFYDEGTCDGSAHDFTMAITGDNGKFAGGKAASVVFSFACGAFECADGYVEQKVQLSKSR